MRQITQKTYLNKEWARDGRTQAHTEINKSRARNISHCKGHFDKLIKNSIFTIMRQCCHYNSLYKWQRHKVTYTGISVDGIKVKDADNIKYVDMWLEPSLSIKKKQVATVCSKLSRNIDLLDVTGNISYWNHVRS